MTEKCIILRSDTATQPTPGMLAAMMAANVGDDVFGEDSSVNALEQRLIEMTGMQAAVFAPTGTQSNLMALLAHCGRGDEYLVGATAHTYMMEGGGAAVLGSIQPQPIEFSKDGTLDLAKVALAIKPIDDHFARSKLLCLENTTGGKVLPLDYLQQIPAFCKTHNLNSHMDGARVFNAAVALNVPLRTISQTVDSISICLSKGLGTPMGSVLCGSTELIKEARHWRKMLGGGMRQIGYMAAAGLYALDHHIERLADDHDNVAFLADELAKIDEIQVLGVNTNILFVQMTAHFCALRDYLLTKAIVFPARINSQNQFRLVTHLDVTHDDLLLAVKEIKNFFRLSIPLAIQDARFVI